jgi:Chaperone of endosialidase
MSSQWREVTGGQLKYKNLGRCSAPESIWPGLLFAVLEPRTPGEKRKLPMNSQIRFNITVPSPRKPACRSSFRRGFPVVLLALGWLALSPLAQAQVPDNANTALGYQALVSDTTGDNNTAIGAFVLQINTSGSSNTAIGEGALFNNTTGQNNTATGVDALVRSKTGSNNTANGIQALYYNTTGSNNTATGAGALGNNNASNNTANGANALFSNTGGIQNTATGFNALLSNTVGNHNTANGFNALQSNTTGNNNTANGGGALNQLTTGSNNTAEGQGALNRLTTGSSNIAMGFQAGQNITTGANNIEIGNVGVAGDANMIRIGKQGTQARTFVAGIFGSTVASGVGVIVNSSGQLGTVLSSERFKEAIKPMDKASEAILSLQPVTFRYKQELDPNGVPQFGLIAEQVDKVNPDLVVRGEDGKVTTVRYEAVNAMLLNEFLKEHQRAVEERRKVEEQGATIAQQKKDLASQLARQQKAFEAKFAQQQQQVEALTATVQKVSDQVALSKPAPQLVANP